MYQNEEILSSRKCFEDAIDNGYLTENQPDDNYAGKYMYMRSAINNNGIVHYFKNINTRTYLLALI